MKRTILPGIAASAFFAFTFILNRSINLSGGFWAWSACLRYFFMLPMMWTALRFSSGIGQVHAAICGDLPGWLLWSTVGFGLFYAPLTLASVYGEGWFVSATWQITIVCGVLLTPLLGGRLPVKNLLCGIAILIGIALMQISGTARLTLSGTLTALTLIIIAAFSYPLGNRKMLAHCPKDMSTIARVYGMTLCSMPFWIVLAVYALIRSGLPSGGQILQSFLVALFSGVIATLLFFEATRRAEGDPKLLALTEATQCGEVVFTLIGSVLFLGDPMPGPIAMIGIVIIVVGMIINSLVSAK